MMGNTAQDGVGPTALRSAMGYFATGVGVVTAADAAGRPFGTTANAVSSLSLEPPLVLACLQRQSATLAALRQSGGFAINLLASGQQPLAERFARRTTADTWDGVAHRFADGVPTLDGALATLECRCHETPDGGDHVIVIGRVVAVAHPDAHEDPLLVYRGAYADLVAPPEQPAAAAPPPGPEIALPSALGALRMLALPQAAGDATVAVLVGEPRGSTGALLHVHRGCLLGDALGSTACGGRVRLHEALERMRRERRPGVIVYHRHGAAGIGSCCLSPDEAPSPVTASEAAALRDAVRALDLRDPVPLGDGLASVVA